MIFALFHEMGHLICGIILGLKPQKLEILPVGFAISFKMDTKNDNQKILKSRLWNLKKLMIAFAGPFVNLIIIFFLIIFYQNTNWIYLNVLIFLFNMLFIYPLDGGRILKYTFCTLFGRPKALFLTFLISNIVTCILTIFTIYLSFLFQNIAYIFVMIYLWVILIKQNKKYKIQRNMYRILENNLAINEDS